MKNLDWVTEDLGSGVRSATASSCHFSPGQWDVLLFKTGRLGDDFKFSSTQKLLETSLGDHYQRGKASENEGQFMPDDQTLIQNPTKFRVTRFVN